jgi:hypothetical protein
MQKVVGSNPISRFFAIALHVAGSGSTREPRTNWNHPCISLTFQALMRISAWNRWHARRLAPISRLALKSASVQGGQIYCLRMQPTSLKANDLLSFSGSHCV